MFKSRFVDNSDNCKIIYHSLVDDLLGYNISANKDIINIKYENNKTSPVECNFKDLSKLINDTFDDEKEEKNIDDDLEVWKPILINHDNFIDTKVLSSYGSYTNGNSKLKSGRIGIENFYQFTPEFRSWTAKNSKMGIDWILNRYNTSYAIYAGFLGWYRYLDTNNPRSDGGAAQPIENFPNGSRVSVSSNADIVYIKINNDSLYDISQGHTISNDGKWTFNDPKRIISIASLNIKDIKFKLASTHYQNNLINRLDGLTAGDKPIHLWIPNGDCFIYFDSETDMNINYKFKIPSNSYISSGLYNIYSNIYRILTLDETRSFASKNLQKARAYRKLAHALSTSPFITDFSINALDYIEIKKIIKEYITDNTSISNISNDIKVLKNTLINISKILQNNIISGSQNIKDNRSIYLDTKPSFSTLDNNLITNHSQLFKKLITKYGAQLIIGPKSNITIEPKINQLSYDNQGIVITQVIDTYCDKTLQDTTITNEQKIIFDNLVISAKGSVTDNTLNISETYELKDGTTEVINTISVPLADAAKPGFSSDSNLNILLDNAGFVPAILRADKKDYSPSASADTYIYETRIVGSPDENNHPAAEHTDASIEFSILSLDPKIYSILNIGILSEEIFLESRIQVVWDLVYGPAGYFETESSSLALGSTAKFIAKATGLFTIQATVITPFGIYKLKKSFYVVNGSNLNNKILNIAPYKTYWDSEAKKWLSPPDKNPFLTENQPVYLNKDKLRIITSKINRIAINNLAGIVWPIKTNLSIREDIGAIGTARDEDINELSGLYKFRYNTTFNTKKSNPKLSLVFNTNNSTVKLHSIFLEKIRTHEPECSSCISFYEPAMRSQSSVLYRQNPIPGQPSTYVNINKLLRTNKEPNTFTFIRYRWDSARESLVADEQVTFDYPPISTNFAPPISAYGGYSTKLIQDMGVDIPDHPKPQVEADDFFDVNSQDIIADNSPILPIVSGYKLDYFGTKSNVGASDHLKMCYQKALQLSATKNSVIPFTKGVLHPNSGWMPHSTESYALHENKCSVLKFNPGARDSFTFNGPAIKQFKGGYINISGNNIKSRTFTSTITLNTAPDVRWDPWCGCDPGDSYNQNQTHKEYIDIDHRPFAHGYRILAGGQPKGPELTAKNASIITNDEFLISQFVPDEITYSFAVTGPAIPADQVLQKIPDDNLDDNIDNTKERINLRNPRVNDFGIKDIEVKLNFLNYVNTKNLVIWLEVSFDAQQTGDRYQYKEFATDEGESDEGGSEVRANNASPLRVSKEFLDQQIDPKLTGGTTGVDKDMPWTPNVSDLKDEFNNDLLYQYLYNLTSMNSTKFGEPFKIILLNQEHIQNNGYNFTIKFSDHSSKYNSVYDLNMKQNESEPYNITSSSINQNIIGINNIIQPTIAATGYSDRETCLYHSILKTNRLNIQNNTFSRFTSDSLFFDLPPLDTQNCAKAQGGSSRNSSTSFKLCMMVMDELDDMSPNDNINFQYKSGFDNVDTVSQSAFINTSLCSWELILHVGPSHKPLPHTNPDLASYGNLDILSLIDYNEPKYPGYSFIADMSRYKHLLPLANYNAPHSVVSDSNICIEDYNDPTIVGSMIKPPDFPTIAIIQITTSIAVAAGFGGGTLIGTLAGLDGLINNPGYNSLFTFFREAAFALKLENAGREIYSPNYFKYPFGSPEKILLNLRKPDSLWHSAEATIFKYHNTPILKPNKYQFIKVQRGNGLYISDFTFNIVSNYLELIDSNMIKELPVQCDELEDLKTQSLPFIHNGITINDGDIINILVGDNECGEHSGIHVVYNKIEKKQNAEDVQESDSISAVWSKITTDNYIDLSRTLYFLTHNAIINGGKKFFDKDFAKNLEDNKVLIIDSRVPYDIFTIQDKIECYNILDRTTNNPTTLKSANITHKALIFKDNKYYSIFIIDEKITDQNTLSAAQDSFIFFIFKNQTSIENQIYKPYNIWSHDSNKHSVTKLTPKLEPTVHSVGSYGNISPYVNKTLLSENLQFNQLQTQYSIFNNKFTDRAKYNSISLIDASGVSVSGFKNGQSYGFTYSARDLIPTVLDTNNLSYTIRPEYIRQTNGDPTDLFAELQKQIYLSTSQTNDTDYRYTYIRTNGTLEQDTQNTEDTKNNSESKPQYDLRHGELSIENDLIEYIPIKILDTVELKQLTDRLTLIDNTQFNSVDNLIGLETETDKVLQSHNLKSILAHYNNLPEDSTACFRPDNKNKSICYKQKTIQKINDLYLERKEIIDLLDSQTIRLISFTYIDEDNQEQKIIDAELLSENNIRLTVKKESKTKKQDNNENTENTDDTEITTSTLTVLQSQILQDPIPVRSFKSRGDLSTNHPKYLDRNILPKIAPKIIVDKDNQSLRIVYDIVNADHYWINLDPKQSTFRDFESNPKILLETRYKCELANPLDLQTPVLDNNICPLLDRDFKAFQETITQDIPGSVTYTVGEDVISWEKSKYEAEFTDIVDWKKITKTRYFNINGDQTKDIAPALEITVKSEEDYYIPVTAMDKDPQTIGNDLSADNSYVASVPVCQTNLGSPGGLGLINSYGERVGRPTRIINIFNLDNEYSLDVMIKRVPRMLRGVDVLSTIYRYGFNSLYRQSNSAIPRIPHEIDGLGINGTLNNNLYYWQCFEMDPENKDRAVIAETPPFFQLQNEMIFRAFFGSVDKIENKQEFLISQYPWELIPYEYDKTSPM
jgi:hypothetical protein